MDLLGPLQSNFGHSGFHPGQEEGIRALVAEGIRSLSTTRAKLTRRPEFGRFSAVPFRSVLEGVEGEISGRQAMHVAGRAATLGTDQG